MTPLFHLPLPALTPAQFRQAREIAAAHGGVFVTRLTRWDGTGEIPAGYLFASPDAAERAAREIASLAAEAIAQGELFK